jgi:mycothiol synthase
MRAPVDLVLRRHAASDISDFVRIRNAATVADGIDEHASEAGVANWMLRARAGFDPADDIVVAMVHGVVVGYGWTDWVETTDSRLEYRTRGNVDPAWRRRGVGSAILAHNEAHLREVAARSADPRPRNFGAWANDQTPGGVVLLRRAGYTPARYFFEMLRPHLDEIEVSPLPDGMELRPVAGTDQLRQLWHADSEAFMDHWGGHDSSDAAFQQWMTDPNFDPSLFLVAWDGDEIAGAVLNLIDAEENAALGRRRGLLDSVFVRRPWRRRGLAAALVGRSLALLHERGMTSAWLGVDADNPTGALGVYERAGFAVHRRGTAYHKPMEPDR